MDGSVYNWNIVDSEATNSTNLIHFMCYFCLIVPNITIERDAELFQL